MFLDFNDCLPKYENGWYKHTCEKLGHSKVVLVCLRGHKVLTWNINKGENQLFVLKDNPIKSGFKLISMKRETQKYKTIEDRTTSLDFRAVWRNPRWPPFYWIFDIFFVFHPNISVLHMLFIIYGYKESISATKNKIWFHLK